MSKIRPTQRIFDVVKEIRDGQYRLPSIQRSFVWEQDRICKLMDSVMNHYPIGSFLVWNPPEDLPVRSRKLIDNFVSGESAIAEKEPPAAYLVLDGQQRMQSLYISFFGSYDHAYLYFKVDSDPTNEENDLRFRFKFMPPEQAQNDNHWVRPLKITDLQIDEINDFVSTKFPDDSDDTRKRIVRNLGKFLSVFNMEENMHMQDVKEDLPYNDVLEVFVRVNSGGMVLTKSDLVFSTIVLSIPDMEEKFVQLVDDLNGNGEFDFDIDFLIKTSFVLFGIGAKYDVKKLGDKSYVQQLEAGFKAFEKALISTLEFLKTDAKILGKRFLKSDLALIPIVDFIYRQPHQHLSEGQAVKLRQYLYMSFFMRFYSYGPDAKLDVLHRKLSEAMNEFPLPDISNYLSERTGVPYAFSHSMLNDLDLVLNIIGGGYAEIPRKRGWSLERDHIFPKSELEKRGISHEFINSAGNLRFLNKTRNILKSAGIPETDTDFFGSNNPELSRLFHAATQDLTETAFRDFVQKREQLIRDKVTGFLGLASLDSATA